MWDWKLRLAPSESFAGDSMRCVSKMMVAHLASFFGVSPFRETQDPCVDSKINLLYKDSMHILDEIDTMIYTKYMSRKIPAWFTKFQVPAKNTDLHSGRRAF
jgi:hypothetical protein